MPKHVVIIENDQDLQEVFKIVLEDAGFQVTGIPGLTSFEELLDFEADCFVIDEHFAWDFRPHYLHTTEI